MRNWSGSKLARVSFKLDSLMKAVVVPGGQGQLSRSELETKSLRKSWRQVKSFALSHGRLKIGRAHV